jgi:hypothetical protein
MDWVTNKIKAVAAAVASFVAVVLWVWTDKAVSLDELNALWLALVPVLTALGVYASPPNSPVVGAAKKLTDRE